MRKLNNLLIVCFIVPFVSGCSTESTQEAELSDAASQMIELGSSLCDGAEKLATVDELLVQIPTSSAGSYDFFAAEWTFRVSDLRNSSKIDGTMSSEDRARINLATRSLDSFDPRISDSTEVSIEQGEAALEIIAIAERICENLEWPSGSMLRGVKRLADHMNDE